LEPHDGHFESVIIQACDSAIVGQARICVNTLGRRITVARP